jgi:hypothetical protein
MYGKGEVDSICATPFEALKKAVKFTSVRVDF